MSTVFRWSMKPSAMGAQLAARVAAIPPALSGLAKVKAAAGEGRMKAGAPWNDQSGFARGALYGRAEQYSIHLGTTNSEYGIFLELGTVKMAPRPIIEPTLNELAPEYFEDACTLIRGILGG